MRAPPRPISLLAAGIALGRFDAPTERVARIDHDSLATWFARQPSAGVQRYTARVAGPPDWRLAQVVLDDTNAIVAARWLEAPAVDALVNALHAQDSFVWWRE